MFIELVPGLAAEGAEHVAHVDEVEIDVPSPFEIVSSRPDDGRENRVEAGSPDMEV